MIRVLIVDSQSEVRRGLRMLLGVQPDVAVVGDTGDACDAAALAGSLHPDVIVADIGMDALGEVDLVRSLRAAAPGAILIALTLRADPDMRIRAQEAGAQTYLEKYEGAADLLLAIREIASKRHGDDDCLPLAPIPP